jgi:uncharacterized membrane protein YqhA
MSDKFTVEKFDNWALLIYFYGTSIPLIALIVGLLCAFREFLLFGWAFVQCSFELSCITSTEGSVGEIIRIMHGVEYLLLAPLPYLVVRVVAPLLIDLMDENKIDVNTIANVNRVKGIAISILIATLGVKMVADALESHVKWESAVFYCSAILVLTLVLWVLERHSHRTSQPEKD